MVKKIKSLLSDKNIKKIILIFIVTRILLLGIGLSVRNNSNLSHELTGYSYETTYMGKIGTVFYGSDTHWYLKIAEEGYPSASEKDLIATATSLVFYPLYPLLIKALGLMIGNQWAGIIISNTCFLGSGIALYFALKSRGRDLAYNATKYLFIFPTSFIFSAILTEALFLFLFILLLLFLQKRLYLLAGVIGFLMALTRPVGFVAFLPIFFVSLKVFTKVNLKMKVLMTISTLLPLLGILVFASYLHYLSGSPYAIFLAEKGWGKAFGFDIKETYVLIFGNLSSSVYFINFVFSSILVLFSFYGLQSLGIGYKLMTISIIGISIFTTTQNWQVLSFARYFSVLFTAYIGVGRMAKENKFFDIVSTVIFLFFQIITFSLWVRGYPTPI